MKNERKSLTEYSVCVLNASVSFVKAVLSMRIETIKCIYRYRYWVRQRRIHLNDIDWASGLPDVACLGRRHHCVEHFLFKWHIANNFSGCISGNVLLSLAHVNSSGIRSPLYEFGEWCQLCCVSSRPLCAL